jgi:hypothetical protein
MVPSQVAFKVTNATLSSGNTRRRLARIEAAWAEACSGRPLA